MTTLVPLPADTPRRPAFSRGAAATLLLALMSALYIAAVLNQPQHAAWGYARAFAEAAMVGGLADWFAVTAIFRHPLGLPIPHTAVIPRSKERIADALGDFVSQNFLSPAVVAQRLEEQDIASALARQVSEPSTAKRIANGAINAMPPLLDMLDDQTVSDFLTRQVAAFGKDERTAAAIGRGLALMTDQGRHEPLLHAALEEGLRALDENEGAIRQQVRAHTGWMWRLISLDARAADALIGAIDQTLHDVAGDPTHPIRERVREILHRFAADLQNSPELRSSIEQIVSEIADHPAVGEYLRGIWADLRQMLRNSADDETSPMREALAASITRLGEELRNDPELRTALNVHLRAFLVELAGRHGGDISKLISDTIRSWDTQTIVAKLEQNVGDDLQYIRINGTLIGGLVGLAIYQCTVTLSALH